MTPHLALWRRISDIARRVLAIILCSGLVHAVIPVLGLRSIKLCAFLLPAITACPRILHLSSRRRCRCACERLECDNHGGKQQENFHQNARGHRSLANLRRPQCGYCSFGFKLANMATLQCLHDADARMHLPRPSGGPRRRSATRGFSALPLEASVCRPQRPSR